MTPPDKVHQGVGGRDVPLLSAAARQVPRPRLVQASSRPAGAGTGRDAGAGVYATAGECAGTGPDDGVGSGAILVIKGFS